MAPQALDVSAPTGPVAREMERGAPPANARVYLRLENITATRVHTSGVEVYVNVPPGGRPADFPDRRAGIAALFGVIEASKRTIRTRCLGLPKPVLDPRRSATSRPEGRKRAGHELAAWHGLKLNHSSTTTSRQRPDPAGLHRTRTSETPDRVRADQGPYSQVVAGVGFEPT